MNELNKSAKFILIDEVYEILTDNLDLLSTSLQEEFDSIYIPINSDMAYVIGDLIRNENNSIKWEIRETNQNMFMFLLDPQNELKQEIFNILLSNNALHNISETYKQYSVVE